MLTGNKTLCHVISIPAALSAAFSTTRVQDTSMALEEIIVTAQKREQSIQDVGLTISALPAGG